MKKAWEMLGDICGKMWDYWGWILEWKGFWCSINRIMIGKKVNYILLFRKLFGVVLIFVWGCELFSSFFFEKRVLVICVIYNIL